MVKYPIDSAVIMLGTLGRFKFSVSNSKIFYAAVELSDEIYESFMHMGAKDNEPYSTWRRTKCHNGFTVSDRVTKVKRDVTCPRCLGVWIER